MITLYHKLFNDEAFKKLILETLEYADQNELICIVNLLNDMEDISLGFSDPSAELFDYISDLSFNHGDSLYLNKFCGILALLLNSRDYALKLNDLKLNLFNKEDK